MFDFLKKKEGDTPPDVGKEEEFEAEKTGKDVEEAETGSELGKIGGAEGATPANVAVPGAGAVNNIEVERLKARIESVIEWINQFYERFSYVSENIGELRSMNLANEKKISEVTKESEKVIDIFKEVKPQDLRIEYQKMDMRINKFEEMVAGNRQFMDGVVEEFKDLKRQSDIFVGSEGLMKLNEDTKKDLVEMQKINSRTKMHADKSAEIFNELKSGFAESQKNMEIVSNMDETYSGLREELEKMKLEHGNVISRGDFDDFRKTFATKLSILDTTLSDLESLKKSNAELTNLSETSLSISKTNEEDIANKALETGGESKKIRDYENQLNEMLQLIDTLAVQVADLKKRGVKVEKKEEVKVEKVEKEKSKEEKMREEKAETGLEDGQSSGKGIDESLGDLDLEESVKEKEEPKKPKAKLEKKEEEPEEKIEEEKEEPVEKVEEESEEVVEEPEKKEEPVEKFEEKPMLEKKPEHKKHEKPKFLMHPDLKHKGNYPKKKPKKREVEKKVHEKHNGEFKGQEKILRNLKKARKVLKEKREEAKEKDAENYEVRVKNLEKAREVRLKNLKKEKKSAS